MKKIIALVTMVFAAVLCIASSAFAAGNVYHLPVYFGQSEAQAMYYWVNDFRAGDDAWYWNPGDSTYTDLSGSLSPLVYDYNLELIAMQRAAELALSYDHTRPDGRSCFTAYYDYGYSMYAAGENIAMGSYGYSASDFYYMWREDSYGYEGQGHRRNMLSSDFNRIGIGHASYGGYEFWVQEFAYCPYGTGTPNTYNGYLVVDIPVNRYYNHTHDFVEGAGGKDATCTEDGYSAGSVCSICGESSGQTVIPATGHSEVVAAGVAATCTEDGKTDGVTCSKCGAVIKEQTVIPATGHTETSIPAVAATCTAEGMTEGTKCSKCEQIIKAQTVIPATGHTVVKDPAIAVTCTTAGKTEGSHCSVCGEVIKAQQDIPSTGHNYVNGKCTVCGELKSQYTGLEKRDGAWVYVNKGEVDNTKNGVVEYENNLFLVVGGHLADSVNGLVQDFYNESIWYFVSYGRVTTEVTSLVMYGGEWFYVVNGILDTNYSGFVTYNEGLFLVGAGRIMRNVSGLCMDPNGNDWYFLSEGQAQIGYTGLAMYNDAWFYVVKGKFAKDYTGTVKYNGSRFRVVKGEVR